MIHLENYVCIFFLKRQKPKTIKFLERGLTRKEHIGQTLSLNQDWLSTNSTLPAPEALPSARQADMGIHPPPLLTQNVSKHCRAHLDGLLQYLLVQFKSVCRSSLYTFHRNKNHPLSPCFKMAVLVAQTIQIIKSSLERNSQKIH